MRRQLLDAYYKALRRWSGRPAKSGPPIPKSERNGRRDFYTLRHSRNRGRKSGRVRLAKAIPRHKEVIRLRQQGHNPRQIAQRVGYSLGWVYRILKGIALKSTGLREHIIHPSQSVRTVKPAYSLARILAYQWHVAGLLKATDHDQRNRMRLDRLLKGFQRREAAYRATLLAKVPDSVASLIVAATDRLVWRLRGEPIEFAIREINSAQGVA